MDKHFRALAGAAFQRKGFAQAELLSHWPAIVGDDIARLASPERISWPKGREAEKRGGTLYLKAFAGRSLDIDYAAVTILERVNQFLGFGAIGKIKVRASADLPALPKRKFSPAPLSPSMAARIAKIDNPDLQDALERLGEAVRGENSPQAAKARGQHR